MTKLNAVKQAANAVKKEIGCTLLEAVTKMQATAAKNKNEEILEALCEFKSELVWG